MKIMKEETAESYFKEILDKIVTLKCVIFFFKEIKKDVMTKMRIFTLKSQFLFTHKTILKSAFLDGSFDNFINRF